MAAGYDDGASAREHPLTRSCWSRLGGRKVRVHGPKSLTRRQVLAGGGLTVAGAGGLTLAGLGGYAWPHPAADSTPAPATPDDTRGVLHFVTRSDLNPPALTIAHRDRQGATPATDPPFFILAPAGYPLTGPGEPGLM